MKPLSSLLMLAVTALIFVSAPLHAATDEQRPRLEHFASYEAFMKAMMAWEARPATPPAPTAAPPATAAATSVAKQPTTRPVPLPAGMDPTSEAAPPPLAITGPEDLDTAVELAKDISHPDYTARIRYNRSTHLSFPLPSIDGNDMSQASIENSLVTHEPTDDNSTLSGLDLPREDQNKPTPSTADAGATPGVYAGITLVQPLHITIETTY
jgi:hypothetical protein